MFKEKNDETKIGLILKSENKKLKTKIYSQLINKLREQMGLQRKRY